MAKRSSYWLLSLLRTRTLAGAIALAALASIVVTYILLTRHAGKYALDAKSIIAIILVNLTLLLTLGAIVTRRAVRLWASLKEGSVGSRLQTRIVAMFTLVTIVPTILVSVSSAMFFNLGIQSWFDERVSTALEESVIVAEAYLNEHKDIIRADALAMAGDLDREVESGMASPPSASFSRMVNTQTELRSLTEAMVFRPHQVLAQTPFAFSLTFERLPDGFMERANHGEVVAFLEDRDKVRALVKLHSMDDTYLLIGRLVDPKVLAHVDVANGSVEQYRHLKENISNIQIEFEVIFVLLALLLLIVAIWYGMHFASHLVGPITKLVKAAERVRGGDFTVRVTEGRLDDEVATLTRAFNRMTDELEKQRNDLIEANRQLDTRRRFSEAVLSGVSAGIMALSSDKRITLFNPVAASLLLVPQDTVLKGEIITEIIPEFAELFLRADEKSGLLVQDDITVTRSDKTHVLHVRVTVERILESIEGYIITFDDITELLVAQRNAAWSDVARRVAHEIKNPLTPIQLAAERLRKKYLPQITVDPENYIKYLDTIGRHVGDIGKIVEEFVTFARMPAPLMKYEDINAIIRKAVFSEQTAHTEIVYRMKLGDSAVIIHCDEQQISRVLLNLLKNAAEAFEVREEAQAVITVQCYAEGEYCKIRIMDNGPGFPPDKIHRLLEPYMTTRAKGTGLGLAIVKKIIDDHKAQLSLENLPEGGACITIIFSIDSDKNVT
jgi:two-component system nitrogen regulation sensor histidine kinase NtrY